MRRMFCIFLGLLMLATAAGAECLRSGLQTETAANDTVFFYDNLRRFNARSLFIMLDKDAAGNATIQRGRRISADSIYFYDDAQTIEPGGFIRSGDDEIYCFVYSKTNGDELRYTASTCGEPTEINELYAEIIALLSAPPPVVGSAQDVVDGLELYQGTATSLSAFCTGMRTYPISFGIPLDGSKAVLICIEWDWWGNGGFTFYPLFGTSPSDTGVVTLKQQFDCDDGIWIAPPDSINMDDSTGVVNWAGTTHARSQTYGTMSIMIDIPAGAGWFFGRIAPHGGVAIFPKIHGLHIWVRRID